MTERGILSGLPNFLGAAKSGFTFYLLLILNVLIFQIELVRNIRIHSVNNSHRVRNIKKMFVVLYML